MASARSISMRSAPSWQTMPTAPPPVPPVPFTPVPRPTVPGAMPDGAQRINAGAEQNIFDTWDTIGQRARTERVQQGIDLKEALAGLNYKFGEKEDGTLDPTQTATPGAKQRQAIQDQKNQGSTRGQLYSSFTDQAIGDALTRISTSALEALRQYGRNIKAINDNAVAEQSNLASRLSELITDDAKWAIEHPPVGVVPEAEPSSTARHWVGRVQPNVNTLASRWGIPVDQIRVTRSGPKSGRRWVATVKSS